jgi:hypothetical protein
MSAALQLPMIWAQGAAAMQPSLLASAVHHIQRRAIPKNDEPPAEPVVSYAFYRKHTENLLKRYLYASTQVGRSPNLLGESVGRGWVSSRRVKTFEDALIFVLDVERCLKRLTALDRQMISRVLIQEFTHAETAVMLGVSSRTVGMKLAEAVDRLTVQLVENRLLILPD